MSDYANKFERLVREHVNSIGGLDLELTHNTMTGYPVVFTVTPHDGFDTIVRFSWRITADRAQELDRFKQELGAALTARV